MSNRRQRRAGDQKVAKMMLQPAGPLVSIDLSTQDPDTVPKWMDSAFQNNRYVVMVCSKAPTTKGPAIRAMVKRHDAMPIPNHWAELQKIKNDIFGPEFTAVEYYPAVDELVDTANLYWLWVYPTDVLPIPLLDGEPGSADRYFKSPEL